LLTAFYVARLIFKVFFGEFELKRINPHIEPHVTDGGWAYKVPLIFLALCCLFPVFSKNPFFYEDAWILKGFGEANHLARINIYHNIIPIAINILSVLVIYWAYAVYINQKKAVFAQHTWLFKMSYHEWFIDVFYLRFITKGVLIFASAIYWIDKNIIDGFLHLLQKRTTGLAGLSAWLDKYIIDGILHTLAAIVKAISNFVRGFQTGKVQYYLFSMLAVILALFIYKIFDLNL